MNRRITAAAVVMVALATVFFISGRFDRMANADQKYTVKSGDTLWGVAGRNGVSVAGLKEANGLSSDTIKPGQVIDIPAGPAGSRPLGQVLREKGITNPAGELNIVIDKSDHTLSLFYRDTRLKSYHVELGEGGLGDKVRQGDKKTPEGAFYITEKKSYSPRAILSAPGG